MLKRPKILWEENAEKLGADLDRVQVWEAFSELFLDSSHTDEELQWLAEIIASSPFCFQELGHIAFYEVGPPCWTNSIAWLGGEGISFGADWLIEKCMVQMKKNPFALNGNPNKLRLEMHLLSPFYLEPYLMLDRVIELRSNDNLNPKR